jgi:hypothetical protein
VKKWGKGSIMTYEIIRNVGVYLVAWTPSDEMSGAFLKSEQFFTHPTAPDYVHKNIVFEPQTGKITITPLVEQSVNGYMPGNACLSALILFFLAFLCEISWKSFVRVIEIVFHPSQARLPWNVSEGLGSFY